jgi:hypothetical protein
MEFTEFSIPVNQKDLAGEPVLKIRRDDAIRRSVGIGIHFALYSNLYHSLLFHGITSSMIAPLGRRTAELSGFLLL